MNKISELCIANIGKVLICKWIKQQKRILVWPTKTASIDSMTFTNEISVFAISNKFDVHWQQVYEEAGFVLQMSPTKIIWVTIGVKSVEV